MEAAAAVGRQADLGVGHGELGGCGGDDHIAGERHAETRARGRAVDCHHEWRIHPHQTRDRGVQRRRDVAQQRTGAVARGDEGGHIATAAEHLALAGEHHGAYARARCAVFGGRQKIARHLQIDRVGGIRPVQAQRHDVAVLRDLNGLQ